MTKEKLTVCPNCKGKFSYDEKNEEGRCDYCDKYIEAGEWLEGVEETKEKEHVCRFNDGGLKCECYEAGRKSLKQQVIESTKGQIKILEELADFPNRFYAEQYPKELTRFLNKNISKLEKQLKNK